MRILVLENGSWVSDELARMLRAQGFEVALAPCNEQTLTAASENFDLIILDVSVRPMEGLKVALEALREQVPVLVLTARDRVVDRVQALDLGADCLAEPFAMPELAARVRALIRRSQPTDSSKIVHGPLTVDTAARRAYLRGESLALLPREWAVLEVLLRRVEQIVSKKNLIQTIAGRGKHISPNTIEAYVSRLRAKLGPAIKIRTVHRFGYVLEAAKPEITELGNTNAGAAGGGESPIGGEFRAELVMVEKRSALVSTAKFRKSRDR